MLDSFGRVVACCRLSLAVDGDAQCLSLDRLVQQLVLSSRGLDVSGVKVTERSFGAVGAQVLHKQRFPCRRDGSMMDVDGQLQPYALTFFTE